MRKKYRLYESAKKFCLHWPYLQYSVQIIFFQTGIVAKNLFLVETIFVYRTLPIRLLEDLKDRCPNGQIKDDCRSQQGTFIYHTCAQCLSFKNAAAEQQQWGPPKSDPSPPHNAHAQRQQQVSGSDFHHFSSSAQQEVPSRARNGQI